MISALTRIGLLVAALVVCGLIIAAHGVRGVALLVVLALIFSVPQTRVWKMGERWLVQMTGSRRRAAAVAAIVVIGVLAAINLYSFFHGQ